MRYSLICLVNFLANFSATSNIVRKWNYNKNKHLQCVIKKQASMSTMQGHAIKVLMKLCEEKYVKKATFLGVRMGSIRIPLPPPR
jgi:hypothetical protein